MENEEFDPAIHQTEEDEYENEKKEKVEKIVNDLNEIQEELDSLVGTLKSFHHYNFHTTPHLLRPNCPDFLNIRDHNNNYDINFGYITSCLHTTEWNNIYIDAIGKDEVRQQERKERNRRGRGKLGKGGRPKKSNPTKKTPQKKPQKVVKGGVLTTVATTSASVPFASFNPPKPVPVPVATTTAPSVTVATTTAPVSTTTTTSGGPPCSSGATVSSTAGTSGTTTTTSTSTITSHQVDGPPPPDPGNGEAGGDGNGGHPPAPGPAGHSKGAEANPTGGGGDNGNGDGNNGNGRRPMESAKRRIAKEFLRTLSSVFDTPVWATCPKEGMDNFSCQMPNRIRRPDIIVNVEPENSTQYLRFPILLGEILGLKKQRRSDQMFDGFNAAQQQLVFADRAYYFEIGGDFSRIFKFEKAPKHAIVDISEKEYDFTFLDESRRPVEWLSFVHDIIHILLDGMLNITPLGHFSANCLVQAQYQDFMEIPPVNKNSIDMHCWHIFVPKYICPEAMMNPASYITGDAEDPTIVRPDPKYGPDHIPDDTHRDSRVIPVDEDMYDYSLIVDKPYFLKQPHCRGIRNDAGVPATPREIRDTIKKSKLDPQTPGFDVRHPERRTFSNLRRGKKFTTDYLVTQLRQLWKNSRDMPELYPADEDEDEEMSVNEEVDTIDLADVEEEFGTPVKKARVPQTRFQKMTSSAAEFLTVIDVFEEGEVPDDVPPEEVFLVQHTTDDTIVITAYNNVEIELCRDNTVVRRIAGQRRYATTQTLFVRFSTDLVRFVLSLTDENTRKSAKDIKGTIFTALKPGTRKRVMIKPRKIDFDEGEPSKICDIRKDNMLAKGSVRTRRPTEKYEA